MGLDVGWRLRETGLRVAYTVDDQGVEREYVLPTDILGRLAHADDLGAIRAKNFNVARDALATWLATDAEHPEWLSERAKTIGQWRSEARLAALAIHWRTNRFDGDVKAFDAAEAWRKQDKHLWTWEVAEAKRAIGHRRELYRLWATELAARYATIVMEDFDKRDMARRPAAEEDGEVAAARLQRVRAAVSILDGAIKMAAGRHGATIRRRPAANTTRRCSDCGRIEAFDAAASIRRNPPCPGCGVVWDQDANAARNLLASADVPRDPAPIDLDSLEQAADA